jgi:hypothetical protein
MASRPAPAPRRDLAEIVEDGDQAMGDEFALAAGQEPVEHGDVMVRQAAAQRHALGKLGDEEQPAACRGEGWRHGVHAEPVSIRLDHAGADGAALQAVAQPPPIADQRAEIDVEHRVGRGGDPGRVIAHRGCDRCRRSCRIW